MIDDSTGHARNNFDFVRFVAASAVLYSHCFALTGFGGDEPLSRWTHGDFTFGGLAVRVFFVISGFLVTTAWLRRPAIIAFVSARALRIFPALAVALLYCVAIGARATTLPWRAFLAHPETIAFYWHNLTLQTEFFLPGVFEQNPFPRGVNGSLWSLYYEMRAYLVVLALGAAGLMRWRWLGAVAWLAAASLMFAYREAWGIQVDRDWPVLNAFACFIGGALVALYPQVIRRIGFVAIAAIAMLALGVAFVPVNLVVDVLLVGGTLWFAYVPLPALARFGRYGDFSYGIFIYAFPTQQLIAWAGLASTPYAMLAIAFPATLLLAMLSWHLVERPCRDLKRHFRSRKGAPGLATPPAGGTTPV